MTPPQSLDLSGDASEGNLASAAAASCAARAAGSRDGRVLISGFFEPQVRQRLKVLSALCGRTQEDLLGEALELLFKAHNQADRPFTLAPPGPVRRSAARR